MPKPPTPSGHHRKPTRPPTPNKQNQPRDHKQRAIQLIGKYAGPHWREAQRAKWVIDMVTAIHTQYARGEEEQTNHIAAMQAELSRAYRIMHENDQEHTREIADLAERLNQTRIGEVEANQKALAAQTRMDALAVRLEAAEGAAEAARAECDQLGKDVVATREAGFLARRRLSSRAHLLRDALVASRREIREKRKGLRVSSTEIWKCGSEMKSLEDSAAFQAEHARRERSALLVRLSELSREAEAAQEAATDAAHLVGRRAGGVEMDMEGECFQVCGVGT